MLSNHRAKVHHIVPQVLQRKFLFREGELWYSKKDPSGNYGSPELQLTEKAFKSPNFYTVLIDGELSDVVEKQFYGPADRYLSQFLKFTTDTLSNGGIPHVEGQHLLSLIDLVMSLIKRTEDFLLPLGDAADENCIGRNYLESVISAANERGIKDTRLEELKADQSDPHKFAKYGRNIRVRATLQPMSRIDEATRNLKVRWAVSETKHSFILPSCIAYRVGNGGDTSFVNPNMEIWMPISPKMCLILLRDEPNIVPHINVVPAEMIRRLNQYALSRSTAIASNSQELLESLTGRRSVFGRLPLKDRGNFLRRTKSEMSAKIGRG
ncbi:DUF4238 domain-containing protein [Sulfitobacter pontiacus]|uniref:DUF4238 domain-containing protein n=1 Tax=Sulfitobacter pontiacus TaxID=60137 RepID=UPI0036D7994F